ncbi:hypothetical protein [Roseibium aggregatum]|uniref:Uncharacterized protein n=1 Tax=Roseibium aggregatum TaxID=187304 RepID=A0A0M6YD38_9HYPH|nr:hypothetical protein [Roseibium aggregatum]CTQ47329.1 hypothetical protein LAL4801_05791 [Roseibium aggregatum]
MTEQANEIDYSELEAQKAEANKIALRGLEEFRRMKAATPDGFKDTQNKHYERTIQRVTGHNPEKRVQCSVHSDEDIRMIINTMANVGVTLKTAKELAEGDSPIAPAPGQQAMVLARFIPAEDRKKMKENPDYKREGRLPYMLLYNVETMRHVPLVKNDQDEAYSAPAPGQAA